MKIAVYGTGGVGGYFGGRLALAGAEVHLIARGAHLDALRTEGLRVRSVRGDFQANLPATDDPAEIGPCDVVLLTVKTFDTDDAASRLGPLIGDDSAVISLQNGVDNEDQIAARIGWQHVMGGVAYIFAGIAQPGIIEHAGGPSSIVFGEMDGSVSPRARRFLDLCEQAGIDARLSDDIRGVLWTKFAFICAMAGMTAAARLPVGEIRAAAESREMFRRLVEEVRAVAAAEGVVLADDLAERHLDMIDSLEPDGASSLYHDLSAGRRMELEALHGSVVRRAAVHGIDVPMSQAVYAVLKPWALRGEPAR